MKKAIAIGVLCLALAGCQASENPEQAGRGRLIGDEPMVQKASVAVGLATVSDDDAKPDIRWMYMTPPLPGRTVNSMYADLHSERATLMQEWIEQAKTIEGEGLTQPLHGRSMALQIVYEDGTSTTVRPAWSCSGTEDEQGNTGTQCITVEDKVWIGESDGEERFAESEPLFEFVRVGYKDWMPAVEPYRIPDTIRLNESFRIEGHGSLMEKMAVQLVRDGRVVWTSEEAAVDHGDYMIEGRLDFGEFALGEYELRLFGVPYVGFDSLQATPDITTFVKVAR